MSKMAVKIKYVWDKLTLLGKIALVIIFLLFMIGVFAPLVTWLPFDSSSGPPLSPPALPHLLGTDELGVDIWSMIAYGSKMSLTVGLGTALIAGFGGGIIGMVSAYRGGWADRLLMRLVDMMIAIPSLPVMIIAAAFFGPSLLNIIIVLAIFSWSIPARIIRAATLSLQEQPYIKMAAHYGANYLYMICRHFIPEMLPLLLVNMIRLAGRAIVAEASLSFLGLGDPTSRSWGLIINHAVNFKGIFFTPFWKWWLLYPWLALTLLVTSFALLGRDLEEISGTGMNI